MGGRYYVDYGEGSFCSLSPIMMHPYLYSLLPYDYIDVSRRTHGEGSQIERRGYQ